MAGIDVEWRDSGLNEVGIDRDSGQVIVRVSREFYRPLESDNYRGDYSKAQQLLGWRPKTTFRELVRIMVESEMKRYAQGKVRVDRETT